jgi:23S rRNA pseudouridine1911/1915/1917 synthase
MAHLGAPVAGDFLYGREDPELGRQALHSETLQFTQPVTGEKMSFRCPLPGDLLNLLRRCGMDERVAQEGDFE